jgi:transcriptional regulator with XRE-family HTH domain
MRWQTEGMRNVTVNSIGEYIREQREQAKISMRQLAQSAGVSNPYLSQIERGLRRPSADILQQIAKGLRISAEALYVQAGILDDRPADTGVRSALLADAELSERQKQVLIEIYESFRRENAAAAESAAQAPAPLAAGESDTAESDLDGDLDGGAPGAEAFTAEVIEEAMAPEASAAEASAAESPVAGAKNDSSADNSRQSVPTIRPDSASD